MVNVDELQQKHSIHTNNSGDTAIDIPSVDNDDIIQMPDIETTILRNREGKYE